MKSGRLLTLLAGIITIVGTYVFAIFGGSGIVGSGIGFITNLPDLFGNTTVIASFLGWEVWVVYIVLILFIIFLAAGVLQIVGMANRVISFIFSLFPIAVALMIILLAYTDILGTASAFFTYFFLHTQIGNIYPFLVPLDILALGVYLIMAGGVLGFISAFLPRD